MPYENVENECSDTWTFARGVRLQSNGRPIYRYVMLFIVVLYEYDERYVLNIYNSDNNNDNNQGRVNILSVSLRTTRTTLGTAPTEGYKCSKRAD